LFRLPIQKLALDLKLREQLQLEIRRVQQALGITTLNVTHDQGEALSMSDRVAVMREGRVLQVDTPVRLYQSPNGVYVARFVGRMNLLEVTVTNLCDGVRVQASTHADCGAQTIELVGNENGFSVGDQGLVAFRPEDAQFGTDLVNQISASVEKATYRGDGWTVACTTGGTPIHISAYSGHKPDPCVRREGDHLLVGRALPASERGIAHQGSLAVTVCSAMRHG
jgi:ABC-type Fe3+/spermidine/putrescine transport system ATPase subunit